MAQRTIHTVFTVPGGWLSPAVTAQRSTALHGNPGPKTSPKFSSFAASAPLLCTVGKPPYDRGCWQKPSWKSTVLLFWAKVFFRPSLSPNFQWPNGKGKLQHIQAKISTYFSKLHPTAHPPQHCAPLRDLHLEASEVVPFWGSPALPAQPCPAPSASANGVIPFFQVIPHHHFCQSPPNTTAVQSGLSAALGIGNTSSMAPMQSRLCHTWVISWSITAAFKHNFWKGHLGN